MTCGKTVDAAAFLFGALDRLCEAQMMVDACAAARGIKVKLIGDEEAEYTSRIQTDETRYVSFNPA